MNTVKRSPAPFGAYVEVDVTNIKEGKFVEQINRTIQAGLIELIEHQKEAETKRGELVVTATIKIKRAPSTESVWSILTRVTKKTPTLEQASDAIQRGTRLLCQPVGTTDDDPRQQQFFDASGAPILADGTPGHVGDAHAKDSIPIHRASRG